MSTDFTYDVIIRHYYDNGSADYLASHLRTAGLRVWTADRQRGAKADAALDSALKNSRIMLLLLSPHLPDSAWFTLETDSYLFRDPQDTERRLITILQHGASLRPGLDAYTHFEWTSSNLATILSHLLKECLPPSTFASQPIVQSDDCPLKRIFSFGHSDTITAAAFNPDSSRLLTASADDTLRIWDPASGQCIQVLQDAATSYLCVAWHPESRLIASGAFDGKIRIWEAATGKLLHVLEGHLKQVNSLAWSPHGRSIISGSGDRTLRLWDDYTCVKVISDHDGPVHTVAWSPDGAFWLSGSGDKTLRRWDAATNALLDRWEMPQPVTQVSFSPDGSKFFFRNEGQALHVWDAFKLQSTFVDEKKNSIGKNLVAAWGPDNKSILLGIDFSEIAILDTLTGETTKKLSGTIYDSQAAAWSSDGNYLFVGGKDGKGKCWNLNGKSSYPDDLQGHNGPIVRTVMSKDGRSILSGGEDTTVRAWNLATGACRTASDGGHRGAVLALAWSPDNRAVLSGSADGNLRLRTLNFKHKPTLLKGSGPLRSVAWSPKGQWALSASSDHQVRLWQLQTNNPWRQFSGHKGPVNAVTWSPNGIHAASASDDRSIRLWTIPDNNSQTELRGHLGAVNDVTWSNDGQYLVSGAADRTVRIWEVKTALCLQVLEGHTSIVQAVCWSPDQRFILSGSADRIVRIWEVATGACLYELHGHTEKIISLAWGNDNLSVMATAANGLMRIWDVSAMVNRKAQPHRAQDSQTRYRTAKVLLLGESGVGKTALAGRLAGKPYAPTTSTDGAWTTRCTPPATGESQPEVQREAWLWDFAGQWDYRLIHQFFMEEADLAILVIDPQKDSPLEGLQQWIITLRRMQRAGGPPVKIIMAAGRIDRGRLRIPRSHIDRFLAEQGIHPDLFVTSALTGEGCESLRETIFSLINWENISITNSPALYTHLKQEILKLRDQGILFIDRDELHQRMQKALALRKQPEPFHLGEEFTSDDLGTVIGHLAGPGIIYPMSFGGLVLLQPEILSRYAAALIRKACRYQDEHGYVEENQLLNGDLDYQDFQRPPETQERYILYALYEMIMQRAWHIRMLVDNKEMLVFPSYFRLERPQLNPALITHSWRFSWPADDLYPTLIVHLHHTHAFNTHQLWHYAADLLTPGGEQLGLQVTRETGDRYRLDIWCATGTKEETRLVFARLVYEHLAAKAREVTNGIDQQTPPLPPYVLHLVAQLEGMSLASLDATAKEGQLVGLAWFITHSAGQLFVPRAFYDKGIDAAIEFIHPNGTPTPKALYLQLKSGDSYLRERKNDGEEIFQIKKPHHVEYWRDQPFPVMLVIRTSDGNIRWMDVRAYLQKATANGETVTQIVFKGEPFTVENIHRWRNKLIAAPQ